MRLERGRCAVRPQVWGWLTVCGLLAGCASPGTPRPPSLQLPALVRDVTAVRSGDAVELRFTVPSRTTDGVAIRGATVKGVLCRQEDKAGSCRVVDGEETAVALAVPPAGAAGDEVVWKDRLPPGLTGGAARVIAYRVELRNAEGKSAGYSEPAYAAAGSAPPVVEGFSAEGTRAGVLLRWSASAGAAGEIRVRRESLDEVRTGRTTPRSGVRSSSGTEAKAAEQTVGRRGRSGGSGGAGTSAKRAEDESVVWLKPPDASTAGTEMVDGTVKEGVRYRYATFRALTQRVGGRTLEMRSAPSAVVEIAWRDVYPPMAPQGLVALGYTASARQGEAGPGGYAVDLVWEPVNDSRVTGYVVTRQRLDVAGQEVGRPERLTAEPVSAPGFHDASALAGESYRYAVTAVDAKGNVSGAAVAVVRGSGAP